MRVAALYDVHGMLPALAAVLADVERAGVDAIVVGGDVAAGPQPLETLKRLRSLGDGVRWVRGNADRDPGEWLAARLPAEARRFLAGLPPSQVLDVDGLGSVLFCHATPRDDEEIVTPATPDERLREILAGVSEQVVVAGHTHMQVDRTIDGVRFVNPGSVGMPYEGEVAAFWAMLGPDVELRQTPFDVEAAVAAIRRSDWPDGGSFVAENLLGAPSREEATAFFEGLARG